MKNKAIHTILILSLMFILFPQSFVGYAKPLTFEKQNITVLPVAGSKNCNASMDPDAPCNVEVFSSSTTNASLTPTSTAQVLTCGVNIYTKAGLYVAQLSESVPVTWGPSGYTFSGATRSTWAASSYGWTALTGPNIYPGPPHGNYYGTTTVDSSGTVTWLGAPFGAHHVYMHVAGTQSTASWDCNGTY